MLLACLVPALLIGTCAIPSINACALHAREVASDENQYPIALPGDDEPADPATLGYFSNHLCINARNATESIRWYKEAFGLRLIFRLQVSEHFSISYMGHAQGGRNSTGYQTSAEMNREKNNMGGLLEITSLDYPNWDLPAGIKVPNTFSHIGMVVPNITETQARLDAMNASIFKRSGDPFDLNGPFSDATGFTQAGDAISQEEIDAIQAVLQPVNTPLLFVADPDGTIIEVQNQEALALL
jgi:lactoylglutathione lyase